MQKTDVEVLKKLREFIFAKKDIYIDLARKIWEKPELGFEEKFACEKQVELFSNAGFEVKSPFAGLDTAYKASFGNGKPVFCFVSEYDALPGLGHACGHNLICSAALAASLSLSKALKENGIDGTIAVMGTPAEESKGGKIIMLENNALDGIDALMMVHPSWRTIPDSGSTAITRLQVSFKGRSAHAAASPEHGLNALDAVIAVFNGVSAWRQQLPETARIHGVISDGGKVPNIIPDHAECRFFLRSPDDSFLDKMEKQFRDIVEGAALMTGTQAEIKTLGLPYRARKANPLLNNAYIDAAKELGMNPVIPEHPGRGSSDFGNFSHVRPGVHTYFGIAKKEIAGHSPEFAAAAISDYGMEQMLNAAAAMAFVGYKVFADKEFREQVLSR